MTLEILMPTDHIPAHDDLHHPHHTGPARTPQKVTLLEEGAPRLTDPVGDLAAPTRLRVDHHRAGYEVLGGTGPSPSLSWEVPTAPSGWTQTVAEVEVTRTSPLTVPAPKTAPPQASAAPVGSADPLEPTRPEDPAIPADPASPTSTFTLHGPTSTFVPWPAAPLSSRERATWRVRVAGADGAFSAWSEPAVVETGLLDRGDWTARPVSAPGNRREDTAPVLVRRLVVPQRPGTTGAPASARLHVTAGGVYEVFVDGTRVGAHELAPGWTEYRDRLLVQTYDVTGLLPPGEHEVAVVLGNGWYRGHLTWYMRDRVYGEALWLLAQLEISDGASTTVVGTDAAWTWRPSNVTANDLYNGQTTDLRLPALGEVAAEAPVEVLDLPEADLEPTTLPLPTVVGELRPQRVITTPSGRKVLDFGQNLTGHVRLAVTSGEPGTTITLRHAEVMEDGELGTRPLRQAQCTDRVVLAGTATPEAPEVFAPTLTQHGFRYVEVEGLEPTRRDDTGSTDRAGIPGQEGTSGQQGGTTSTDRTDVVLMEAATARVVSAGMERSAWFSCDQELVNRLVENTRWSTIGNFITVPTDCPQRDERLGWTGDIAVFAPTALSLYDAGAFLASWCRDLVSAQTPDGAVPVVVPDVLDGPQLTCAWGDAVTLVPWAIYEATGDTGVLKTGIEAMERFVAGVAAAAGPSRLWCGGFQFGDWLDPDAPPEEPAAAKADPDVVATAYFARSAQVVAQAYKALGRTEDAQRLGALAGEVRQAYLDAYVTANGLIVSDCATVYAQALAWGLLDTPERVQGAGDRLADLVRARAFRISTGFVGTPLVPAALVQGGHPGVAARLILETGCPSWLYPVTMGATTTWERWDSMLPDGSVNPGEMTSFNHYALGAVTQWLVSDLAGLEVVTPGGGRLRVAPQVGHGFSSASVVRRLPGGTTRASWRTDAGRLHVRVQVPVGAQAELVLPGAEAETVGHGLHERVVTLPASHAGSDAASRAVRTVRDLVDDPRAWQRLADAATQAGHPMYTRDAPVQLASLLRRELDRPVSVVAQAATVYGFVPGMEATRQALSEVVEGLAP